MKAIVIHQYGGREVLKQEEIPAPVPKSTELLVEVHACALNPVDYKLREGHLKEMLPLTFPHVLGGDIAGIVRGLGKAAQGFEIGDEVYFASRLDRGGGYAEFCVVDAGLVAKKPKSTSFAEAASLPVVGLTTLQALRDYSKIKAGDQVLIHAGAGGLGSFAIQYAKHCGARVLTTGSNRNFDYLKSLGADQVIDYHTEDFVKICSDLGGMDIVFETIGGLNYPKSILATKEGGTVPCVVNPPDSDTLALAETKKIKTGFLLLVGKPTDLDTIASLLDRHLVHPNVTKILTLADVRLGHQQIESGRTQGKWVIQL